MAQNVYDDPEFFANYSRLDRSVRGLDGAPEWPRVQRLFPPVDGARVLDLGCGFGRICRWAAEQGASEVVGIDLSAKMLERAREETADPRVRFVRADLDEVTLADGPYRLVVSSLALHYLRDVDRLFREVAGALEPGGRFVALLEHPIFTAPTTGQWAEVDGRSVWPLEGYSRPGPRVRDWLAPGVLKQHRPMAAYVQAILDVGMQLVALEEWVPDAATLEAHPDWVDELERPMFLILGATRPG